MGAYNFYSVLAYTLNMTMNNEQKYVYTLPLPPPKKKKKKKKRGGGGGEKNKHIGFLRTIFAQPVYVFSRHESS